MKFGAVSSIRLRLLSFMVCLAMPSTFAPASGEPMARTDVSVTRIGEFDHLEALPDEPSGQWCADPRDQNYIFGITVVRSGQWRAQDGSTRASQNLRIRSSTDGGRTWRTSLLTSDPAVGGIDPACAYGEDGKAYVVAMAWQNGSLRGFNLWRSENHAGTWSTPTFVDYPEFFDRPFVAVDRSSGRHRGRIFVTAASHAVPQLPGYPNSYTNARPGEIVVLRSDDGGQTFSAPVRVPTGVGVGNGVIHNGQSLVLANGSFLISWTEGEAPLASGMREGSASGDAMLRSRTVVKVARSSDEGMTFEPAFAVASGNSYDTFDGEMITSGKWYASLAAASNSSDHGQTAYAVWAHLNGTMSRIYFAKSSDEGRSWSRPRMIQNVPAFRENQPLDGPHQVQATVAVNVNGDIGVSYYQSEPPGESGEYRQMVTISRDDGTTWTKPVSTSSRPILTRQIRQRAEASRARAASFGVDIPLAHPLGLHPDCRWDLVALADGAFLAFPLSGETGDWRTTVSKIRIR